jgi:DNA-directed RNA polymerase subunit RPC12/RpoP
MQEAVEGKSAASSKCPVCGHRLILFKAIAGVGSLPALRTYKCEECGVRRTETGEARNTPISSLKSNLYLVEPASSLLH